MASSRSMNRPRRRNRPPRREPLPPPSVAPPLDEETGPLVLLAFIAAGLKVAVAAHAASVRRAFEERIEHSYDRWPQDVAKLEELRLTWQPMRVEVELFPSNMNTRMVAPRITLTARSEGFDDRIVEIFLCQRGLVVIETTGWPRDVRAPAILKDPDSAESAAKNAAATVAALIRSMGTFNHPLDMT